MLVATTTEGAKISREPPCNYRDILFFIRGDGGIPRLRARKWVSIAGVGARSRSRRHGKEKGFYNQSGDWKPSEGAGGRVQIPVREL
jgi:hypothetical protein